MSNMKYQSEVHVMVARERSACDERERRGVVLVLAEVDTTKILLTYIFQFVRCCCWFGAFLGSTLPAAFALRPVQFCVVFS